MPVRKRGETWWIDLSLGGRRSRISAGKGSTKEQALELEAKHRSDYHARKVGRAPDCSISDAFARWLTGDARALKSYDNLVNKVRAWYPFLRNRPLTDARDIAEEGKAKWLKAGLKVATVNRRLAALRRVCKLAHQWGWTDYPIQIRLLPGETPRMVQLDPKQAMRLLSACRPKAVREAVLLAALTGLRTSELLRLTEANRIGSRIVLDAHTKSGRPRTIPISPDLAKVRLPLAVTAHSLRIGFEEARAKVGMPWLQFRDLRRTFGSWIVQNTGSLKAAQDLLGHSTIAITARHYAHLLDEHLDDAVASLPRLKRA